MTQDEWMAAIADLEREIAMLPEGSITKKKIRDREYFYHRVTRNGKRVENYIAFEALDDLRKQIEHRKKLEEELKSLKKQMLPAKKKVRDDHINYQAQFEIELLNYGTGVRENSLTFKTLVRTGSRLRSQIAITQKYKKRECICQLRHYIFGDQTDKVFVIYGLRRTGKTTMIRQILTELSESEFRKAAFIQVRSKDTLEDIDEDLRLLENNGFKYVFIDEVTLMEDFIEGAALFSDIYASSGMKIVLSGTDAKLSELSVLNRQRILDRLLSEIHGRMMEEIVLLETKIAHPDRKVFKLQFAVGEFDMVVFDPQELHCQIYEVKYSREGVPEQSRHLRDEEKCALTRHRYGDIVGKYVIYRGETCDMGEIKYLNVEEYLKSL